MIGQTLSHFRITAKLGQGGMGEVWKAEDMKLGREVAIKVLPAAFTEDAERLARFEREARVLASLNHPSIAGIHEVGEDAGVHFLAMELAQGEELAERLARGPMPVAEALDVALQIAEALEAAHESGIVHRDLKPQNVKITPEGGVKVLDFGLAKALDPGDPSSEVGTPRLTHSPTMILGATMEGVILGTAAYMAPEQAKGRPADKRADIWAFGVVLWEMLSGERMFEAPTAAETLARVLTLKPDPEKLPRNLPQGIRRLLERCLRREPRSRLRDIGDARLELLEAGSEPLAESLSTSEASPRVSLPWAVAAAAIMAAVLIWARGHESNRPPVESEHLKVRFADLGREVEGQSRGFMLSPAGDRVVIDAPGRLLVRHRESLEASVLVDGLVDGSPAPFWSPDGAWVAYATSGRLWKVASDGGSPKVICSVPANYNAGAWGADGRIVFVLTRGDMYQVSARGGNPELLLERVEGEDIDFHQPTFLPDGRSLVYSVHRPAGVDTLEVLAGGSRKVIYRLEGEVRLNPQVLNAPIYSATGHLLYRRDPLDVGVWALPFSLSELRALGDPFLVAGEGRWPSVSADGQRLAYALAAGDSSSRLVRVAADGSSSTPIVSEVSGLQRPSISPDGDRIAFSAEVGSGRELFVTDLEGRLSRLTNTLESENSPNWSSDGRHLFFQRGTGEGTAIYRMQFDGSAPPEKLVEKAADPHVPLAGRWGAFNFNSREILGIGYFDLETGQETVLLESASAFAEPKLAPNGRLLAYIGWETGQAALSVRLFPEGATSQVVGGSQQSGFGWSPDSRALYYWHPSEQRILAVGVTFEPTLLLGPPKLVLDLMAAGLAPSRRDSLDVFPGGDSFLLVQSMNAGEGPGEIVLVESWLAEFGRPDGAK